MSKSNHMVQFAAGVLVLSSNNKRVTDPLPTFNPTVDQLPGNPFATEPVDASLSREEIEKQRQEAQEKADREAAEEQARLAQEAADKAAQEEADLNAAKEAAAKAEKTAAKK